MSKKPVVLCILDGWGIGPDPETSAPAQARTPTMDRLMATCPHATLTTHGNAVGLPEGQMGNSEVGHMNIGAGRVVWMDLGLIDKAISDGTFRQGAALMDWAEAVKADGGRAHLMGVISDGGVHGHVDHVIAACEALTARGLEVVLHAVTDGRDVPPRSADGFVEYLAERLPEGARVGTLMGRYWAMDRDRRWDRVRRAFEAMAKGEGERAATPAEAVANAYARDTSDEFVAPTVLEGYAPLRDGDGFFCLNFRADRAREILSALADPQFGSFETGPRPKLHMLGMVDYSTEHDRFMSTLYPKQQVEGTLAAWVAGRGLRQFHLAETEKYPHVTFFLNGGKEAPEPGEERYMAQSPDVATYDLKPEMSAAEVTERLVEAIRSGEHGGYDLIVVNYANPDMVGHTGDLGAAVKACEAVDAGLGRALEALEGTDGAMVVCADHGNCDVMVDPETGKPHTAHTLNPVPVILWGGPEGARLRDGVLADLAPTVLRLMDLPQPEAMTGRALLDGGAA
jgi:2,3-bisphosphoglycerate-independent phosphoglycerate mutase